MSRLKGRKTSVRTIHITNRVRRAVELRTLGWSLRAIAKECGYNSEQAAHMAIKAALERSVSEATEEYRMHELARLDAMLQGIMPAAQAGDCNAIDRVIKIMQQRLSYIGGLEVPKKIAPTTPDGAEPWEAKVVYLPSKSPTPEAWSEDVAHLTHPVEEGQPV
jgi:hypothetical protein